MQPCQRPASGCFAFACIWTTGLSLLGLRSVGRRENRPRLSAGGDTNDGGFSGARVAAGNRLRHDSLNPRLGWRLSLPAC